MISEFYIIAQYVSKVCEKDRSKSLRREDACRLKCNSLFLCVINVMYYIYLIDFSYELNNVSHCFQPVSSNEIQVSHCLAVG